MFRIEVNKKSVLPGKMVLENDNIPKLKLSK